MKHIETYKTMGAKPQHYLETIGINGGRIFLSNSATTALLFQHDWATKQIWASCLTLEYAFGDIEDLPSASSSVSVTREWKELSVSDLKIDTEYERKPSK